MNDYGRYRLVIDPEFESKIPPLTHAEYIQLEENILEDGIVMYPIIVWNGIVIDGHNRYRIAEKHPCIQYTTREMEFPDRYAVLAWMCKTQLGRRNLTDEQKKYLIGKQYEAEKASHGAVGGFRGNQYSEVVSGQNDQIPKTMTTGERIAKETGTSDKYVRRAERFAKGVDLAESVLPGIRMEILSGKIKPTHVDVMALARAEPKDIPIMAQQLRAPPKNTRSKKSSKANENGKSTQDDGGPEAMLYELSEALESLIFRWSKCIEFYSKYSKKKKTQTQISKLIRKGHQFLNQIEGGFNQS